MVDDLEDLGYELSAEEEKYIAQLASDLESQSHANIRLAGQDSFGPLTNLITSNQTSFSDESIIPALSAGVDVAATSVQPAYLKNSASEQQVNPDAVENASGDEEPFDDRTPIQRFRSFPKRPLTVTDLTSGAWCELQYWYTLSRLPGGKRTRTQAMRDGSKLHQKLEDEVHETVHVEVATREDGFGLRLWNFIHGLRTLRETGLTRELEVWGTIDGNLVNGVIDHLSYESPNPNFEEQFSVERSDNAGKQTKLTNFFVNNSPKKAQAVKKQVYLTDVKTRGSTAPVSKALVRPAKIQLMLYHRMLSDMAAGRLKFFNVLRRYGLDADEAFSDTFLAEMGGLHEEMFDSSPPSSPCDPSSSAGQPPPSSDRDAVEIKYQTLRELLVLVREEISLTFPDGDKSMGNMLCVQYVQRDSGETIHKHDFPVVPRMLDEYLQRYMQWWRGERKASGVDIEEAFKCRTCEFVDDCTWRQSMDDERVKKARDRVAATRR